MGTSVNKYLHRLPAYLASRPHFTIHRDIAPCNIRLENGVTSSLNLCCCNSTRIDVPAVLPASSSAATAAAAAVINTLAAWLYSVAAKNDKAYCSYVAAGYRKLTVVPAL
eukprot:12434-Heterococcus_DN1.PRE.4